MAMQGQGPMQPQAQPGFLQGLAQRLAARRAQFQAQQGGPAPQGLPMQRPMMPQQGMQRPMVPQGAPPQYNPQAAPPMQRPALAAPGVGGPMTDEQRAALLARQGGGGQY